MRKLENKCINLILQVSPTASAVVATSYLQDLIEAGFLPPEYTYLAWNTSKITRERKKAMVVAKEKETLKLKNSDNIGINFDGRQEQLYMTQVDISVTVEPDDRYLCHGTPDELIHPNKPAKKFGGL